MQNSQASDPTIAKLLEVDADLAVQEVELTLQLQSIQEKRHSLKNVISLFPPVDTATRTPVTTPTPVVEDVADITEEAANPKLDKVTTDTIEAAPQPSKRQGKKNLSPSNSKPSKKAVVPAQETVKEAAIWQQYLQDEFVTDSLAVAVFEVMQQQPERVLEITAILDAIFVVETPKDVRSTARERVSNVLSVGAKKGKWYRGKLGKYSMSKAAVEDSATR
ncbi:hypothetical protein [Chlorogloea sp. CCALA 695]|uniref:hypothetical protein n=1 Tax=Chlorogloea sp. CCALA 695 TaxID=2107693 RepID=UPI0018EE2FE9|nr:hypothetical protein [Chlorogloea sp. CCALA 695]